MNKIWMHQLYQHFETGSQPTIVFNNGEKKFRGFSQKGPIIKLIFTVFVKTTQVLKQ